MLPAGLKRTKIRAPRKPAVVGSGSVDYDTSWNVLSSAIRHIQRKNVSQLLYEQLYRKAYSLVLGKCGQRLYDDVSKAIGQHLRERRDAVLAGVRAQQTTDESGDSWHEELLKTAVREWADHLQSMKFILDVLMYLNRVYVRENKKLMVYDLGVVLFDMNFVRLDNMALGSVLIDIVVAEMTKARQGHVITTRSYLAQVVAMFEMLSSEEPGVAASVANAPVGDNLFHNHLEPALVNLSASFYTALSAEMLASGSGSRYLADATRFIHDEELRLRFLVPATTFSKLVAAMDNAFIKDKIDRVMLLPKESQGLLYWLEPAMTVVEQLRQKEAGAQLLLNNDCNDLRVLYDLIGRVDSDRRLLKARLKDAIVTQGSQLPQFVCEHLDSQPTKKSSSSSSSSLTPTASVAYALSWVDSVLALNSAYGTITMLAFRNDPTMDHAIYEAIREFVNGGTGNRKSQKNSGPSAPELLSVYMDAHIKQLVKMLAAKRAAPDAIGGAVDPTQEFLNKSLAFLRFVRDKDAFEAHYANHFAKRFLNSKGTSSVVSGVDARYNGDIEELVIAKLAEELGSASLEKIIRMKKDVKASAELTGEWKAHVTQHQLLDTVELELKVCHVADWPKSMTRDYKNYARYDGESGFIWPSQVRDTIHAFEHFWLGAKRNDNKSLFWSPKFGLMELRITYPSRTYDISLSTFAGVIMLLYAPLLSGADGAPVLPFVETREYTYEEIQELTGIPDIELKRQLQSVAVAPRSRLLVKSPMTKDVNPGDKFRLNDKFKAPSSKVKVLTVSAGTSSATTGKSEKTHEAEEVRANIDDGRNHLVNAAVVRILKSRRSISHNDLVAELYKQLQSRFHPTTLLMKQRIEDLIDKEYLKRDDHDPGIYHYVA